MAPKDVHDFIPRTCEHVTFYSKRDFAEVIKDHEKERLSWIKLVGSSDKGLYMRVVGGSESEKTMTVEAEVRGREI